MAKKSASKGVSKSDLLITIGKAVPGKGKMVSSVKPKAQVVSKSKVAPQKSMPKKMGK